MGIAFNSKETRENEPAPETGGQIVRMSVAKKWAARKKMPDSRVTPA